MSEIESAPFTYTARVDGSGLTLELSTGMYHEKFEINQNHAELFDYFITLLKRKMYPWLSIQFQHITIGFTNKEVQEFQFQNLRVPVIEYHNFILTFLMKLRNCMLEMEVLHGTHSQGLLYVVPRVQVCVVNSQSCMYARIEVTTPTPNGVNSTTQMVQLETYRQSGIRWLIENRRTAGVKSVKGAGGAKFQNMVSRSESGLCILSFCAKDRDEQVLLIPEYLVPEFMSALREFYGSNMWLHDQIIEEEFEFYSDGKVVDRERPNKNGNGCSDTGLSYGDKLKELEKDLASGKFVLYVPTHNLVFRSFADFRSWLIPMNEQQRNQHIEETKTKEV